MTLSRHFAGVSALALVAALSAAAPAQAATVTAFSNTAPTNVVANLPLVAEGRIGGRSTFEFDIGATTSAPAATGHLDWGNGTARAFNFSLTGNQASWTVNGQTLNYVINPANLTGFDGFTIRTFTLVPAYSLSLTGLSLTVGGGAAQALGNLINLGGNGNQEFLRIGNLGGDPLDGFSLTGMATFAWTSGDPRNSHIAFQIGAADLDIAPTPTAELPEPGTWASLMLALGFMAVTARRRIFAAA